VVSMLLAEDLLLMVTDDSSGRLSMPAAQVDAGLGGVNLHLRASGKEVLS
jgi:hypothetical protein